MQNPNGETSLSSLSASSLSTEEQEEEENEVNSDNRNSDNEDIHEQIKTHLQETIRLRKRNKTSSVRKKKYY